jgi:hypothetical protein
MLSLALSLCLVGQVDEFDKSIKEEGWVELSQATKDKMSYREWKAISPVEAGTPKLKLNRIRFQPFQYKAFKKKDQKAFGSLPPPSLEVEFLGEDGKVYKKVVNVGDNSDCNYLLKVIDFELSLSPKEEKVEEKEPVKDDKLEDSPLVGIWTGPYGKFKFYRDHKVQEDSSSLRQGKWSVLNKKKGRYTIVWAHVLDHTVAKSSKKGGHPAGTNRQRHALVLLKGESELLYRESWVPFTASSEDINGDFAHFKKISDDPDVEPKVK